METTAATQTTKKPAHIEARDRMNEHLASGCDGSCEECELLDGAFQLALVKWMRGER